MIHKTITLSPFENATLTSICATFTSSLTQSPRRAVIVCPGGAYRGLADHEADPVAHRFLAAGFATFVLRYGVGEDAANFAPLCQIALAIKHIRENATAYNVDPDYIFTCGFSAGGHRAGSAGVLWNIPEVKAVLGDAPEGINRPTGMILCYPVITAGEYAHKGSFYNLCGSKEATQAEMDRYSLELHEDGTTPPAFLWHTFSDAGVPVKNSLLMAEAMVRAGVPCELHVFPKGHHGLGLCTDQSSASAAHCRQWIDLAIRWAQDLKL